MIATSDLLEQIKGLKARILKLGATPIGVTLADSSLLGVAAAPEHQKIKTNHKDQTPKERTIGKESTERKENSPELSAPSPFAPAVTLANAGLGKLGWRARRILEAGLDLTATLKQWQIRGERNDAGLDLVLHPEEFSETVALADGSLRLLELFPEAQAEQNLLCEGLEIVLIHLRQRVAFWDRKWELVRTQQAALGKLMQLAESDDTVNADLLQNWRDLAGEVIASAKKTGLWNWIDRSGMSSLSDWAESTWDVCALAARFGLHLGMPEKEIRSLVLGALLMNLVHAHMPGYLHGKAIWDENDRSWYAQWHRNRTEELPDALKPWANREGISPEHQSILKLLGQFNALQLTRSDRPGLGPLAALAHLEKNRAALDLAHFPALVSFVEKEGTLIEAGSLGAALIWNAEIATRKNESAPKATSHSSSVLRDRSSPLRALVLGPADAGSQPSQGPYWVSLPGGYDGAVKELTGKKRARWHTQLLAGAPGQP